MIRNSRLIYPGYLYFLFLFLFWINSMSAQDNISFHHINVENGLSQNSVLSITQDAEGYIWFGTRFGLNKYDTNKIRVFKNIQADTNSLSSSDYIRVLYCDSYRTLWIGTSYGLNEYHLETETFKRIVPNTAKRQSIEGGVINTIVEDASKNLWVGTKTGLNLLTDRRQAKFRSYLKGHNIYSIVKDGKSGLWIGSSKGLIHFAKTGNCYQFVLLSRISNEINSVAENNISSISVGKGNTVWLATAKGGLYKLNATTKNFKHYMVASGLSSNNIRKVLIDRSGKLWIGTQNGINICDTLTDTFQNYRYNPNDNTSLSQNSVYDIFQDNHGSVWVGTYYGGINVVYPDLSPFTVYKSSYYRNSISSNIVSSLCQGAGDNLWIGTEAEGLNVYNQKTNVFKVYKNSPAFASSLSSNLVKAVYKDKSNTIWVGTQLGGLDRYNASADNFTVYKHQKEDTTSISSNNVTCLLEDSKKRFWVGTSQGLNLFDKSTGKFSFYRSGSSKDANLPKAIVLCLYEDSNRNIWIGTIGSLLLLRNNTRHFISIQHTAADKNSIASNKINCIREDSEGNIWFGNFYEGLSKLNLKEPHRNFTNYTTKDGLPGNNILGILEEKPGILWLSTDNGLSRFDTRQKQFRNFNINDGLPGNVFNFSSYLKDNSGKMFFGGYNGLVSFIPALFRNNNYAPAAVFTGIKLFNKDVSPDSESSIKTGNNGEKSLKLDYDQNVLTVEFACLNYIKSANNSYAYKLQGFEKDWNYVSQPVVTYTNLREGNYTLLVRGCNNDGVWSNSISKLSITILPPLWRTWWAYLLYIGLIASVVFMIARFVLMRELLKKEHEVHQLKLDFFTNISHEIRTPLTLILAPLEKMLSSTMVNEQVNAQLQSIKDNADRLMRLVTELLDFRKAESGHMDLHVTENNVVDFVRHIYLSFEDLARSKNLYFSFDYSSAHIKLYFDRSQIEKVIFNLLSNAFKFSNNGSKVEIKIEETGNTVQIKVNDNGIGIPLDKQEKLFSTFYQVNDASGQIGSGVGLALCKSIIELHRGNILVNSNPETNAAEGFTSFCVVLSKGASHFTEKELSSGSYHQFNEMPESLKTGFLAENVSFARDEDRKTILVIEDNAEMRKLVRDVLSVRYNIIEAANGLKGLDVALEHLPDLIISDIMMPGIDGLEVCTKVKLDPRTSHIPLILLTAKAAHMHQLAGLQTGADIYMVKPFSIEVLELNVKNLLASRELMRLKFSQIVKLEPTNVIIDAPDQIFLNKIMNFIEDHINDPNFNVPMLSAEMGMSQPILYKKIRALTDLSVNDFIKSIRLKKAAQLLVQKVYNISEVAYAVGFSDPKYFTKEFRKQFGKSPTEFIKESETA